MWEKSKYTKKCKIIAKKETKQSGKQQKIILIASLLWFSKFKIVVTDFVCQFSTTKTEITWA